MLIDLHLRAPGPEEGQDLGKILSECKRRGIDGACVAGVKRLPNIEEVKALRPAEDFLLFFSAEFPLPKGRLILIPPEPETFKVPEDLPEEPTYQDIIQVAKATNACVIASHPYDRRAGPSFADAIYQMEGIHAIEVANAGQSEVANRLALEAALRLRLVPVAGTGSATNVRVVGRAATAFIEGPSTQSDLVRAILAGEVIPVEILRPPGSTSQRRRRSRPSQRSEAKA